MKYFSNLTKQDECVLFVRFDQQFLTTGLQLLYFIFSCSGTLQTCRLFHKSSFTGFYESMRGTLSCEHNVSSRV